ncbi:MAG: hypothetical protein A2X11_02195 [Bacteroidetes bacterium GWE2_42_24]|nr:MAG: hypothetical protein A2X11_02195 [Bacteroidetes bacterium GWE2_42_24]OFY25723.1 MAG: hypothetical protein A2X09_13380 [Bacteroidetes bacterium GWF2_43_11]
MLRTGLLFLFLTLLLGLSAQTSNIVVVNDTNGFTGTISAIDHWGGISNVVKPGQKIGLLINSDFSEPGAYVNPDLSIAVVKMCFEAGASEVISLQDIKPEYWQRSANFEANKSIIGRVRMVDKNTFPATYDSINFTRLDTIPGAKALRKAEVVSELFKIDVFIDIPVAKHHATTILTCCMKNLMGVCTRATNVTMHLNGPKRNDPVYLAQCITDIFVIRKPDLYIVDALMGIVTNGPNGPGEIVKSGKIIIGTDPVALDSYCAKLLGFPQSDVPTLQTGESSGLGTANLENVTIREF